MNEMSSNRNYDNRYYDDAFYGNRESYRDNYREDYREDYRYDNRENYRDDYNNRRDYDRRGGKINNRDYRSYRNYREGDFYEEIEMAMEDMKEQYRKLEEVAEMAHNPQDKNLLMKIAQKEKDNYHYLKQMTEG